MYRGGNLARSARHSAIGYEGNLEAPVLQYTQIWHEFMQLRHAVGSGALKADHCDKVPLEFPGFKFFFEFVLV